MVVFRVCFLHECEAPRLFKETLNNTSAPRLIVVMALPTMINNIKNQHNPDQINHQTKHSSIQVAVLDDLESIYWANQTPSKSISRDIKDFNGNKGKESIPIKHLKFKMHCSECLDMIIGSLPSYKKRTLPFVSSGGFNKLQL